LLRSREAVEYWHRVGDISNGAYALHDLVPTLAAQGEPTTATAILGALEGGVMQAMAYQWPPETRARAVRARR